MKKQKWSVVLLVSLLGFLLGVPCGQASQVMLPILPAELLKCLPTAGTDWKMEVSKAEHVFNIYPLSIAERVFTRQQAAIAAETSAASAPESVKITLVDVANNVLLVENFEQDREKKAKRIAVNSLTGYRMPQEGEADRVEILVQNRLLLTVVFISPTTDKVDEWLDKIDANGLQKLAAEKAWYSAKNKYDFTKEYIDELDPKKSKKVVSTLAAAKPDPKAKDKPESEPEVEQSQAE
jgi:hypothetical protein